MKQTLKNSCFLSFMLLLFLSFTFSGCSDDDIVADTGVSKNTTVEDINSNIKALQALLAAKSENKGIKSCTLVSSNTYNVELEDGTSVTVRTAIPTIGEEEKQVYVPQLSVSEEDGKYYWMLDGAFLTDDDQKMVVTGTDVPEIGIDGDNSWTIKYGSVSKSLGSVENGTVKSLFSEVVQNDELVIKFLLRGELPYLTLKKVTSDKEPIQPTGTLRRIIDQNHPAWFVHIDVWNYPDPQAIIDLIPEEIRPYVIFNISFSSSQDEETKQFIKPVDGYNTAKSWLRVCAENNVWAMVQASSGGYCHWPDFEDYSEFSGSLFEEFFQEFPNFIGFNYAEQGWGFASDAAFITRLKHFSNLLRLCHEYGGHLAVSFFNPSGYGAALSGIGMFKRSPELAEACLKYPENFIPCEKYTQSNGFLEMESTSLGVFLSGYANNYGIRFDECGWDEGKDDQRYWNDEKEYQPAAGALPVIEHMMFTGETVMDGPELIWKQCFKENGTANMSDGYKTRKWTCFDQFTNISMDIYRKILDGTIRIMNRKEVIDRTKVVIVNDMNPTGEVMADPGYSAPTTLYQGLYQMDGDGAHKDNRYWFKKTGRYPAIPVVARLADDLARTFQYQINASQFRTNSGWGNLMMKQRKFNDIFPEEYTSNGMFAGRYENGWVVYNCYADTKTASIPFKYNTCQKMQLEFGKYSVAVVKEYSNSVDFYLSNYTSNRKNVIDKISIYGSSKKPTYTFKNRISGNTCTVSEEWKNDVLCLTISHNGALDLHIDCAGTATDRETSYSTANIIQPVAPAIYNGTRQYEAEVFEYKNIGRIESNAAQSSTATLKGFVGLGYLEFGTDASASVRETASVNEAGRYAVRIRYCAPTATIKTVAVYVNGHKVSVPEFATTGSANNNWQTVSVPVDMSKGKNKIELKAENSAAGNLYFDYITVEKI